MLKDEESFHFFKALTLKSSRNNGNATDCVRAWRKQSDLSHLFILKTKKEKSYRQHISPNLSLKTPHKSKGHMVIWPESEITKTEPSSSTFMTSVCLTHTRKNDSEV